MIDRGRINNADPSDSLFVVEFGAVAIGWLLESETGLELRVCQISENADAIVCGIRFPRLMRPDVEFSDLFHVVGEGLGAHVNLVN